MTQIGHAYYCPEIDKKNNERHKLIISYSAVSKVIQVLSILKYSLSSLLTRDKLNFIEM